MPEPRTIHVAIMAWRRRECAVLAANTFQRFHRADVADRLRVYLGMDGGSGEQAPDDAIPGVLADYGYDCIMRHARNEGIATTFADLVEAVCARGNLRRDLLLVLEEDWECVRPLPLDLIDAAFSKGTGVGWIWLFGREKGVDAQGRTLIHDDDNRGLRPGQPPIAWTEAEYGGVPCVSGRGYWGHPPAIIPLDLARILTRGARTGTDSAERSARMDKLTLWQPEYPCFRHMGEPGYKAMGGKR